MKYTLHKIRYVLINANNYIMYHIKVIDNDICVTIYAAD